MPTRRNRCLYSHGPGYSFLGVSYFEAFNEINTKSYASVLLDWLTKHFNSVIDIDSEHRTHCATRVFLHICFIFLGYTLFRDKNDTRMSIDYLPLLHSIKSVHIFFWDVGALAWLDRQLGLAS